MKKLCLLVILAVLLCGCQAAPTFETLEDVYNEQTMEDPLEIGVSLPDSATMIRSGSNRLYLCDGYDVTVEVMAAGDLNRTMQSLTGFAADALTMVQTSVSEMQRYECVWTSAGEGADQVGRAMVLDDGSYHYCVTLTATSEQAGKLQEVWNDLMNSITLK